jgi:hypothetical protein
MRKFLIFTLLIVYTGLASGINLQLHYCGGKLKTISLMGHDDEHGCCGNKMKSKDCCENKHSYLKVKDSHHINSTIKINTIKFVLTDFITPQFVTLIHQPFFVQSELISYPHAPPVSSDNPLYLKYRVLII